MYKSFFKRIIDLILSFFGILFLCPILLVFAIIIKSTSKGPVLFKQVRVGKKLKPFTIYKFRSMRIDTPDMPTHLLENPDSYITKVGAFMRKTSIDELPQLFNILSGKMAVIGPRPALFAQEDLIAERNKYGANDVRPGLTGWAQINGRDELAIEVKAKFDGEYIEKLSFGMDIKCFLGTIMQVLKGDGVVEGKSNEDTQDAEVDDLLITESVVSCDESVIDNNADHVTDVEVLEDNIIDVQSDSVAMHSKTSEEL